MIALPYLTRGCIVKWRQKTDDTHRAIRGGRHRRATKQLETPFCLPRHHNLSVCSFVKWGCESKPHGVFWELNRMMHGSTVPATQQENKTTLPKTTLPSPACILPIHVSSSVPQRTRAPGQQEPVWSLSYFRGLGQWLPQSGRWIIRTFFLMDI